MVQRRCCLAGRAGKSNLGMTKLMEARVQASVHEAKTNLSKLLEAVGRGERVVITRHGVPAAELVPARPEALRIGGLKDKLAPPPEAFLSPLSDQELCDWGAD